MTAPENKPPMPYPPITEATREFVRAQKAEPKSALEKSIEHWERMRIGTQCEGEEPDAISCALCRTFPDNCSGCPVNNVTGRGCSKSPYYDARFAWEEFGPNSPEFRAAAQKELDFLKSLRPTADSISNQKDAE